MYLYELQALYILLVFLNIHLLCSSCYVCVLKFHLLVKQACLIAKALLCTKCINYLYSLIFVPQVACLNVKRTYRQARILREAELKKFHYLYNLITTGFCLLHP